MRLDLVVRHAELEAARAVQILFYLLGVVGGRSAAQIERRKGGYGWREWPATVVR